MKYKFNPLTGEFNLVPDSGTLKQKLNWLTGEFNLTKDASKYKQIYNVIEGEFNLYPATTQVVIHGVGSVQLTNAVENGLLSLKAYGGTEQRNLSYTQLEYIQGSGTQYIDTGIKLNQNNTVEVKYCYHVESSTPTSGRIFGARYTSGSKKSFSIGTNNGKASADTNVFGQFGDSAVNASNNITIGQWDTYKLSADGFYVNDIKQGDFPTDTFETPFTVKLFAFEQATSSSATPSIGCGTGRCKEFKVLNGDTLVMDLIPAKNTSNVIGMYDLVSGQFFANAGTGTFTAGPNVVPTPTAPIDIVSNNGVLKARHQSGLPIGYTLLDYIKSGGNNYIDTGIKITNEDIIEMQYLQTADKGAIYGEYYNGTANMSTTLYGNLTFYFYGYNAGGTATSVGDYDTNVHTVVHNFVDGYIDFDGVRTNFDLPSPNSFTNTLNCPIFGRSNGSSIGYFSKTQLYYFRIRRNGTLILDLIPAKDSNNNVGMYDRVSGTLFTESGSGSFTAGNTVADPMTVYADGTTETIGASYLNTSITFTDGLYIGGNGNINTEYANWKTTDYIAVVPGTYKLTFTNNHSDYYKRVAFYTSDIVTSGTILAAFDGRGVTGDQTVEFTVTQSGYVRMCIGKTDVFKSLEIPVGEATAEMLLKVGDYADEQEILSGNITRNVGIKVLDGTETFTVSSSGAMIIQIPDVAIGATNNPINTHFALETSSTSISVGKQRFGAHGTKIYSTNYYMKHATITTAADFKQWLTDQYNAGTPVIVVYPLATPTTETVAGQTMNIPAGDSTIEITQASIDNLELEATYEQEA